jgi:hypothetical protein
MEQFYILLTPQLRDRERLRGLLNHVGVDQKLAEGVDLDWTVKRSNTLPPPPDENIRELEEFFAPHNEKLFKLLGVDSLDW